MNEAIKITGVAKSFGSNEVLKNINLSVPVGKTIVTLGKSGSGKSVLLKCIVRLEIPDEGSVTVLGNEVTRLHYDALQNIRKRIGFIFQSAALYDSMTVRQNLEFPLVRHFKLSRAETDGRVEEVLDEVGLLDSINKMPSELSGGMRKRIGVARTIIMKPEVMLWDEPTTGLDPATAREISNLIRKMQEKYGISSIVVTHDMLCTRIVADSVVVIKDGENTLPAAYEQLEKSNDEFIKSFFI
jgi:phospholipid/cholesterol/gamma-HCH transport system ATP-binding protein